MAMTKVDRKRLKILENEIGIEFKNIELLEQALTHSSYVYESTKKTKSNERLEFLGDAVLSLVISEYIYTQYPLYSEGALAKMRAAVVSRPVLARHGWAINLGKYLLLGKGEEATGGRERESILANAFEAIIGAIYLDQGLEKVREFILSRLDQEIALVEREKHTPDSKTLLQEFTQDGLKTLPKYEVIKVSGPDHKQLFEVRVSVNGVIYGTGKGRSKKQAEQNAAKEALENLKKSGDGNLLGFK